MPADQDFRTRLMAHGFAEQFLSEDHPPATHYHLAGESSGFYVEFLTPLVGGEYGRGHKRKATAQIAGISSQQLRHIELLLHHPWSIDLRPDARVRVANPVRFIVQEILIHRRRGREDRAKDILYIHDTLELFGAHLPELRELWRCTVAGQLLPRSAKKVTTVVEELFGAVTDDARRAAGISAERGLSANSLREACRYGFFQIFSS